MTQKEKWKRRLNLTLIGVYWSFILPLAKRRTRIRYRRTKNPQWLFEEEYGFVVLNQDQFKYYTKIRFKYGAQKLRPREADKICIFRCPEKTPEPEIKKPSFYNFR